MQSESNTRGSDSLAVHEWCFGLKHNPLGLRSGLCLGKPEQESVIANKSKEL